MRATISRQDRRPLRTRRDLRGALVQRLLERSYDELSVGQLLETADIGRSTFYSHYNGKDDLLRNSLRQLHEEIRAAVAAGPVPDDGPAGFRFAGPLLAHVRDHLAIHRNLGRRGREIFTREMDAMVTALVREALADATPALPAEALVQFLKGGFLSLLAWGLSRPSTFDAEALAAAFDRLASASLAGVPGGAA